MLFISFSKNFLYLSKEIYFYFFLIIFHVHFKYS